MKKHYVKVDSRNRVCLTKVTNNLPELFSVYIKDGAIILEPVREIPKNERWLFEPEHKELLKQVKEGLKQKGSIDLGSFKDYLKE
jgi:hypothetical protein